jgi:hypothetical protein
VYLGGTNPCKLDNINTHSQKKAHTEPNDENESDLQQITRILLPERHTHMYILHRLEDGSRQADHQALQYAAA